MSYGRSRQPYGVLAFVAQAALRFAARRTNPNQRGAWRSVALFWRRKRKESAGTRTSRVTGGAGAVWLPQFHLQFITRVNDRPRRGSTLRLSPVTAIHQGQVVMAYQRTIVQSAMVVAQSYHAQRPIRVFSLRFTSSVLGTNVQASAPYANSARLPITPLAAAWAGSRDQRLLCILSLRSAHIPVGANVQAAAPYASLATRPIVRPSAFWATGHAHRPMRDFSLSHAGNDSGHNIHVSAPYANSARQPIGPPAATWPVDRAQRPASALSLRGAHSVAGPSVQAGTPYANSARRLSVSPDAARTVDRAKHPHLGRTSPSVGSGISAEAQEQASQSLRTYKREPHLFHLRSAAMSNPAPPRSQDGTGAQPYFQPQELVWHRSVPTGVDGVDDERPLDSRELARQAQGRSFLENEAASRISRPFGQAPTTPALKIDSALMDRLADDVIRRVEQRARISRARQGL